MDADEGMCDTCGDPIPAGEARTTQMPIFECRGWTLVGFDEIITHRNC